MPDSNPSRPRPSLTWWILALSLVPMLGAAGWALLALSRHPENASDREAAAALLRVAPAVQQELDAQAGQLGRLGAVIARDPKFYAVLTLPSASRAGAEYREALESVLRDFQRETDAPVFAVTDARGKLLGRANEPSSGAVDPSGAPFVLSALRGKTGVGYLVERERVHRVAAVPISAGGVLVGTLTLGRPVDAELGGRLKTAMEADVTITLEQDIAATTLVPSPLRKSLAERLSERTLGRGAENGEAPVLAAGGRRYLAVRRPLEGPVAGGGSPGFVLTRPLGSDASPLAKIERDLVRAAGLGLALAVVCGGVVALAVRRERRARDRARAEEILGWTERERSRNGLLEAVGKRVLDPAETVYTITDLVADGALGELTAPQREGMLAIRRASRGLVRLAQDLSAAAALERGEAGSPAPVEIGNLVEHAATLLIPVASERGQMVEISVEPGLVHPGVDERLFSRVIEGLSMNLVERAPSATKVVLAAQRSPGGVEVVLTGAEPEEQEDRPEASGEDLSSTLARLFAERHEGSFQAERRPERVYRIWLPTISAPAAAADRAGEPTVSGEGSTSAETPPATPAAEPERGASAEDGRGNPADPAQAA